MKQLGVNYVLRGGPRIPWQVEQLQEMMDTYKAANLTLANLMIGGFDNAIYGRPGKDEEIDKVRQSIRAAGKVGLPVVEYNFYAHRIGEGYYKEQGLGGAGLTASTISASRTCPLPEEGANPIDEMWANATYFLQGRGTGPPECRSAFGASSDEDFGDETAASVRRFEE